MTANTNPEPVSAFIAGRVLTLAHARDQSGSATVTLRAAAGEECDPSEHPPLLDAVHLLGFDCMVVGVK